MLAITLAGGAWTFAAFIVFMTIAVILTVYTRRGSGINQRSYSRRYGDAPGAAGESKISGKDGLARMSSRGTR
jgi:hypothetical protein